MQTCISLRILHNWQPNLVSSYPAATFRAGKVRIQWVKRCVRVVDGGVASLPCLLDVRMHIGVTVCIGVTSSPQTHSESLWWRTLECTLVLYYLYFRFLIKLDFKLPKSLTFLCFFSYGVATGTYGVALLPDKDNKQKELYLHTYSNNQTVFSVPKFYWKIVYDKKKKVGDVIIGVNNPHLKEITKEYQLCKNICNSMKWLKVKKNTIQRGHIYCCEMDEFLKATKLENMFLRKIWKTTKQARGSTRLNKYWLRFQFIFVIF